MLPKINRLLKKTDFDHIYEKGSKYFTKFTVIYSLKNNLDFSRFGFVVSKKVDKRAVKRNKIKRRLREIIRVELKERKIKKGFDIIIIAKRESIQVDYVELKKDLKIILKKL